MRQSRRQAVSDSSQRQRSCRLPPASYLLPPASPLAILCALQYVPDGAQLPGVISGTRFRFSQRRWVYVRSS